MNRPTLLVSSALFSASALGLIAGGCESDGPSASRSPETAPASTDTRPPREGAPVPVASSDFRGNGAGLKESNVGREARPDVHAEMARAERMAAKPADPAAVTAAAAPKPAETLPNVVAKVGDPKDAAKAGSRPLDGGVTIDALVGQINGKPIYADRFFSPLDARLRTDRSQARSAEQFLRGAREVIYTRLQSLLIDELLTAEARAELTPEQRQGLFFFVQQLRESTAAQYGGSREEAEQRLKEKDGKSFEEQVQDEKRRALQQTVIRKYVMPKVQVTWRDVLRAYEKEYLATADKAVAVARMIMVDASNADAIKGVTDALAAGQPFEDVANLAGNLMPKGEAGVFKWNFTGDYAAAKLLEDEALNAQATKLTPGSAGDTAGPFDYKLGPRKLDVKAWIKLVEIQRPTPAPLEEVQLKLLADLTTRKRVEEQDRFFRGLIERASFSPLTDMLEKLLIIAQERYPAQTAAAPRGTSPGGVGSGGGR